MNSKLITILTIGLIGASSFFLYQHIKNKDEKNKKPLSPPVNGNSIGTSIVREFSQAPTKGN